MGNKNKGNRASEILLSSPLTAKCEFSLMLIFCKTVYTPMKVTQHILLENVRKLPETATNNVSNERFKNIYHYDFL